MAIFLQKNIISGIDTISHYANEITSGDDVQNPAITLNLEEFMASVDHGGYYSYNGSLTTPSRFFVPVSIIN